MSLTARYLQSISDDANIETGTMDLAFNIDEKQPSYIERIDIRGNTKTKDRVIRRELAVRAALGAGRSRLAPQTTIH